MTVVRAVLLAAGTSSRMGTHKLLLELGGEPLVRRSVRTLLKAGCAQVNVVLGRDPDAVKHALEGLPCQFAFNPDFASAGMERSLRTGVQSLPDLERPMLLALADQPFVSVQMLSRLMDVYDKHKPYIAASRYGEVIAPPHIFGSELLPVLGLDGHGAKPLIQKHLEHVVFLDQPLEALFDIDTPEDLEQARAKLNASPL